MIPTLHILYEGPKVSKKNFVLILKQQNIISAKVCMNIFLINGKTLNNSIPGCPKKPLEIFLLMGIFSKWQKTTGGGVVSYICVLRR